MNEALAKFKEWWATLAVREKQAVAVGGVLLGIFIFYAVIWSPYLNHIDWMRKQIASDQKTLVWMQAADNQIQKSEGKSTGKSTSSSPVEMLSVMQKQISQAGLEQYLTNLKQATNDSIEAHFQKVEFDKLIKMIISAASDHGIVITQMTVNAENSPGIVNADLVLKHSGHV